MFIYHYMGYNLKMPLKEEIRPEVQSVLLDIANGKNIDRHIRMHDDGEITEQLAEMGDRNLPYPPPESQYRFVHMVRGSDGDEIPLPRFVEMKEMMEKTLRETIAALESKNSQLLTELQAQTEKLAELDVFKVEEARKRKRKEAFSVGDLIVERKIDISGEESGVLCRAVISSFKRQFPDREVFFKHSKTYFYPEV